MSSDTAVRWLNGAADVGPELLSRVTGAYEELALREMPVNYHSWVEEEFGLDMSSVYGGYPIGNPWAKASGQLSMTPQQLYIVVRCHLQTQRSASGDYRVHLIPFGKEAIAP